MYIKNNWQNFLDAEKKYDIFASRIFNVKKYSVNPKAMEATTSLVRIYGFLKT